eukprot:1159566-Pelagomonas_calceolata.AAC.24
MPGPESSLKSRNPPKAYIACPARHGPLRSSDCNGQHFLQECCMSCTKAVLAPSCDSCCWTHPALHSCACSVDAFVVVFAWPQLAVEKEAAILIL